MKAAIEGLDKKEQMRVLDRLKQAVEGDGELMDEVLGGLDEGRRSLLEGWFQQAKGVGIGRGKEELEQCMVTVRREASAQVLILPPLCHSLL